MCRWIVVMRGVAGKRGANYIVGARISQTHARTGSKVGRTGRDSPSWPRMAIDLPMTIGSAQRSTLSIAPGRGAGGEQIYRVLLVVS
jgi:hypothetical protein